ncbi:MAG: 3-dehydroquinate synthase [Alphaproteobacteria bacterium]|nr:3-dehydroquinate synthase [Alphaproteobacteria bacterium]
MTDTVRVELERRSYDILVGERLLSRAGELMKPICGESLVIVISDRQVARFYLHRLTGALEDAGIRSRTVLVDAGEGSKSLSVYATLMEQILEHKPDRSTVLVALGGGVVGDLTGFAAATLLRGVRFIQIPTTLLAQVDSSVGGKTGINSAHGKNLIGAFHQPSLVMADIATLTTLPVREKLAGYAEIVKYGLIQDADFFSWLETHGTALLGGDSAAAIRAVTRSCRSKAAIVSADETEQGQRALLNFGHTFGHALEAETGFSDLLLHGEAVAVGMVAALRLSVRMGLCPPEDLERTLAHYRSTGLPACLNAIARDWSPDALLAHMTRDKKAKNGQLTLILSRGIGRAFIQHDVAPALVLEALAASLEA